MALVQKAFSDIITFSRSSNATRVGPTGLVEYAPHNLALRSQEFDNASWTKTRSSVTANAIAAPDGTVTADKLVEDTTASNTHFIVQSIAMGGSVDSSRFAFGIFAKAGERSRIRMFDNNQSSSGDSTFDLSAGTVVTGSGTITNVGNGWYRCTIYPLKDFSTTSTVRIFIDNGSTTSYTGDGTSGIYLWGAQLSVGPYALDYTPTTTAAVYGPRFDYDPVTLAARGLLVEEQRVNVYTYSEQFDNVAWTKGGSSITANAGTAPDGTVTADKIVEDSGTTAHVAYQTPTVSAVAYTLSVFAKAAERTQLALDFTGGSNNAIFNLSAGTVVSSTGSGLTAAIQDFGNGWYRCSITQTQSAGTIYPSIGPASGGNRIYTGNGSSGILIWGAQLEAGSFATSLIPTLASTVTRSADVASVNTLSPWYSATEGTLYAEWTPNGLTGSRAVASANDGTSSELIEIRQDITDGNFLIVDSTTQANIGLGALTAGSTAKVAGAYKLNDVAAVLNGGTVQTDTAATLPTVTALELGARGGVYLSGHLRRVAFYPRRLSNSEIDALTS